MTLPQTEPGIEPLLNAARQGQIEVLSTEQQVITDGCPLELNVAAR